MLNFLKNSPQRANSSSHRASVAVTTGLMGLIYDYHDGLMTGFCAELRVSWVYRLEELVHIGQAPPSDQLRTTEGRQQDGGRADPESEPAGDAAPLSASYFATWTGCGEEIRRETLGRLQPWSCE